MTDRCAPPDGTAQGSWHWYGHARRNETGLGPIAARWTGDRIQVGYRAMTSSELSAQGFYYLRPARPDDAEARERLHRWVMAMMPTLNAMAAEDMAMEDCRDAIDIVSEIAADLKLPYGWDDDTLMEALHNAR